MGANIVIIGGGTGSFAMLSAMKNYTKNITAVVNMADDGGSTGILRDELGVLPPGDVRQCLVALSNSPRMRDLFNYRFEEGTFGGHPFGNILLTALEKVTGNFAEAIDTASAILRISGKVVPATLDDVRLKIEWSSDSSLTLHGERVIDAHYFNHDPRLASLSLIPNPRVNQAAIDAIHQADLIVIAPGDLYTSLGPLLVIDGIGDALRAATGLKVYVANLVTKVGQTAGFSVSDHAGEIERFAGGAFLDFVLYNEQIPTDDIAKRYHDEGAYITPIDVNVLRKKHYKAVAGKFLGQMAEPDLSDKHPVTRSLIRHDSNAMADAINNLYLEYKSQLTNKR